MINIDYDYLIQMDKYIKEKEKLIKSKYPLNLNNDKIRLNLIGVCPETNKEESFLLQITRSNKCRIKITLHHQECNSHMGLIRIDYNGAPHENPKTVLPNVPTHIAKFVGARIEDNHIHYHINGYKNCAWAIPLTADSFNIKNIEKDSFNVTFANIIKEFTNLINMITPLDYQFTLY